MAEVIICLLQRNPVCGLAFLGVDEVGVDLGGFDAPMGEHLGDRIDIRAKFSRIIRSWYAIRSIFLKTAK